MDKNKLNAIAVPLSDTDKARMQSRRQDRYWKLASSAIAAKIQRQLKVKGITRMKLAEMLDITPANITRYLSGETNFELKTLVEIERVLGIDIINRQIVPTHPQMPVISSERSLSLCSNNNTAAG